MNPCGGAQWPWTPGPNGSLPRAAYRKCLCRKPAPTIFSTAGFWPAESRHYSRWKVCRTQDEQPISGSEYSPSGYEQLGRQDSYSSVTI
jgi:hypothetical protein